MTIDRDANPSVRCTERRRRASPPRLGLALLAAVAMVATALPQPEAITAQDSRPSLPATADVAPETALMYFSLDLNLESDQWQRVQALLARAGFPNAIADLERSFLEDAGLATPSAGGTDSVLEPLLGGELALVFTGLPPETLEGFQSALTGATGIPLPVASAAGENDVGSGLAAVLLPGDPDAAFAFLRNELTVSAENGGDTIAETVYRDVEIATQTDEFSGPETAIARLDDHVLVAQTPADLEPLIDTATGEVPSLAAFAPATDIRAELNPDLALFGYVNGERLVDALGPAARESLQTLVPTGQGVQTFDYHSGFGIWADDPGLRIDVVALPPAGGSLPDQPDNFDPTLDERVSADSFFFVNGVDLGPSGAGAGVALALAQAVTTSFGAGSSVADAIATPAALTPDLVEDQFAAAERVLGFDLRIDLLDQLVDEYAIIGSLGVLPGGVGGVFTSGVNDPAVVAESLRQSARLVERQQAGAGVDVSARRIGADTVYLVRNTVDPVAQTVEFGVVDGQLLVGVGTGLDDYLAGPTRPLAADERYRRVLATLPAEHNQVLYIDLRPLLPGLEFSLRATLTDGDDQTASIDADLACTDYGSQAEAQTAADAGEQGLDQDFDGTACEDFFGPAGATPVAVGDLSAVEAYAQVAYERDGLIGASGILYIAEP